MTTDPVLHQLQQARPATYADDGWAASRSGQQLLADIHRATRRDARRPSRGVLIATSAAALVAAGGATAFAVVQARTPVDRHAVLCNQTASLTANGARITVRGDSPTAAIAACAAQWTTLWPDTPKPPAFAVCVYPATPSSAGGGQVVLPSQPGISNAQLCAAAGANQVA